MPAWCRLLSKPVLGILIVLGIAGVGLAVVYLSPSESDPNASTLRERSGFNTDPIPDTPSQGALHQGENTTAVSKGDFTGLLGMEAEGGLGDAGDVGDDADDVDDSSLGSNLGENGLTVTTTVEPAGFDFDPYDIGCVNTALGMRATGHPSYWTWDMIFPDLVAGGIRDPTADELTTMEACIREECSWSIASAVSCDEETEKKMNP